MLSIMHSVPRLDNDDQEELTVPTLGTLLTVLSNLAYRLII